MKRETYYMLDIETTGVDKDADDVLEIGIVEIRRNAAGHYWLPTGREFHRKVYSPRQPETVFAKEHMAQLYAECNLLNPERDDIGSVGEHLRHWLGGEEEYLLEHRIPRFFMGWNASNFDLEFLFRVGALRPSYYNLEDGKEVLRGDAHYRVYEQTGAIEFLIDVTGLSRDTIMKLAEDMSPFNLVLPEGKQHDAIYDCYSQINMMNGLIALGRSGFKNI